MQHFLLYCLKAERAVWLSTLEKFLTIRTCLPPHFYFSCRRIKMLTCWNWIPWRKSGRTLLMPQCRRENGHLHPLPQEIKGKAPLICSYRTDLAIYHAHSMCCYDRESTRRLSLLIQISALCRPSLCEVSLLPWHPVSETRFSPYTDSPANVPHFRIWPPCNWWVSRTRSQLSIHTQYASVSLLGNLLCRHFVKTEWALSVCSLFQLDERKSEPKNRLLFWGAFYDLFFRNSTVLNEESYSSVPWICDPRAISQWRTMPGNKANVAAIYTAAIASTLLFTWIVGRVAAIYLFLQSYGIQL